MELMLSSSHSSPSATCGFRQMSAGEPRERPRLFVPPVRGAAVPSAPLSGAGRRLPLGSSPPAVGSERPAAAAHHGHIIAGAARPLSPAASAPAQWRRCSPSPELSPPPGGPSRPPRWSGTASRRRPRPRPGEGAAGGNVRGGRAWAAGELRPRAEGGGGPGNFPRRRRRGASGPLPSPWLRAGSSLPSAPPFCARLVSAGARLCSRLYPPGIRQNVPPRKREIFTRLSSSGSCERFL